LKTPGWREVSSKIWGKNKRKRDDRTNPQDVGWTPKKQLQWQGGNVECLANREGGCGLGGNQKSPPNERKPKKEHICWFQGQWRNKKILFFGPTNRTGALRNLGVGGVVVGGKRHTRRKKGGPETNPGGFTPKHGKRPQKKRKKGGPRQCL